MKGRCDFDLLCIGSGPAGQRAAVQAAKLGKRAAIIEKRRSMGGVCLETGTIPSKTFREAVLSVAQVNGRYGGARLPHRTTNHPTAAELLQRVDTVVQREGQVVDNQLWRNEIHCIVGEASFKDPHTVIVASEESQRTVTAEHIVIAVGTVPAPSRGVPVDGDIIISSDDIVQLTRLPKKMVVVGGGIIGIEYASMLGALEVDVTLVDKRERLLEFLDYEIVDELMHQMRNRHVRFRLGEAVESVDVTAGAPQQAVVHLESGKRLMADQVLFSVGRIGATARLNLAAAGLTSDPRGRIKVDQQFRTDVSHIFAVGDVIGYPSLASTSFLQGRLAACYAFGVEIGPMAEHLPIGIYAIPELSAIGPSEQELTQKKIPYETGIARYREIARGQILGDESGLLKLLVHRDDQRLLGVHAVGTSATELIHIGQAVLELGGGLQYFLRTVFNYPTLAECYKVAALNAFNKLSQ
ncbi:Si-specific NAD(P)(+) transhydrogenase [Nitrospira sp. Nam74]